MNPPEGRKERADGHIAADSYWGSGSSLLCAGLVRWGNLYFGNRYRKSGQDRAAEDRVEQRLDEIDHWLTEVQDVMIALSEKFDRFEDRDQR